MDQRRSTVLAWSLLGTTLFFTLVDLVLLAAGWSSPEPTGGFGPRGVTLIVGIPTAVMGTWIVSRLPSNPIGWLLCAIGLASCLFVLSTLYAIYGVFEKQGSLPGAELSAWLTNWLWTPIVFLLGLVFLLFPDGKLLSPRWRVLIALLAIVWLWALVPLILFPGPIDTFREVENPFGVGWSRAAVAGIGLIAGFLILPACAGSLVPRYRRAGVEGRAQIRWVVASGLFVAAAYLSYVAALTLADANPRQLTPDTRMVNLAEAGVVVSLVSIPLAVGVAILKYRLYDVDVVINKAVMFALLGAFITVVYAGVVVGVGAVVGSSGNAVLSAVAAAVVALAFQPVRRWAQRVANRFVYGKRATPYEVLHQFSERVAGSYGTEDVLPRMATILGEGTGAERAQVWLRIGSELRSTAAWPPDTRRSQPVRVPDAALPPIPDVSHAVAVRDREELLGALSVTKPASEPVSPTEGKLVADLALQAGLVLRNVRLVEDLRASRGRLVAAQDQERRRIERNIHDGAQQQLVALQVKQRLAEQLADRDLAKAKELLAQIQVETAQALDDLRDLARGIYPPLLADKGLTAALEAQARKAVLPVSVRANGVGRYIPEVEATVYFCVLEALQNAAKYSSASSVEVALDSVDGALTFTVSDDGRGFDPDSTPSGSGLQNMSDRLEAVGGTLEISSSSGIGTRLRGRIPIEKEAES